MLITPHALVGAAIGASIPNPALAIPLAISSHFILDSIPHWQPTLFPYQPTAKTWLVLFLDLALAIYLVAYTSNLYPAETKYRWLIAVLACTPDLDSVVSLSSKPLKIKLFKKYYDWHCQIQRETDKLWGLIPQILVIIISLVFTL